MSVWRDMARDAGMTPLDEAAAWIEEQERRADEERQYERDREEAAMYCPVCGSLQGGEECGACESGEEEPPF